MSRKIEITVVGSRCVYVNDHRVAGKKPYVSENLPQWSFTVDEDEILRALGRTPTPVQQGCICPPTSERTCQNQLCPRKALPTPFPATARAILENPDG